MYHARVMRIGRPSRLFPQEAVARRVRLSTASLYQSSTPLPCRPATVMSGSAGVPGGNPKAPKDPSEGLKELYITAARYRQASQQATTEAERKERQSNKGEHLRRIQGNAHQAAQGGG